MSLRDAAPRRAGFHDDAQQQAPKAGQTGDVRPAGFTATELCPLTGFCLVLDGATGGNNAFAILALVAAYRAFGEARYLDDAESIGRWIVGYLTDHTGTGYGGYFVGYPDEGVPPPKPLVMGKSTENNADIFAAFHALAAMETERGNSAAAATWMAAATAAGDFVMQMFDPDSGAFNAGTIPLGTKPQAGICPDGPQKGSRAEGRYHWTPGWASNLSGGQCDCWLPLLARAACRAGA